MEKCIGVMDPVSSDPDSRNTDYPWSRQHLALASQLRQHRVLAHRFLDGGCLLFHSLSLTSIQAVLTQILPFSSSPDISSQVLRLIWVELCFCCSLSHVWLFAAPWTATCQASLFFTISWSLLKLMSIESMMPSKDIILCCSLLLLPSVFPSFRVFSNESGLCIRWPQYWSFSFSISPSNEYSGLISFRIDWFDLLAVQETLKSLLQHHSSKASILWHSALFMVQLSHPYMTIGKTIALTRWTFVRKVMPLLFNMLSRLVIAFLPRNKCLLISWLQSPSAVILEPKKIKSITVSIYLPRSDETGYHDLSFLNVEL